MPKTVAAVLEWDYLHRAEYPLDPKLRAKMRNAARGSGLGRKGGSLTDEKVGQRRLVRIYPAERTAFVFARKLSMEPWLVGPDVAELRRQLGPKRSLDVIWWACRLKLRGNSTARP